MTGFPALASIQKHPIVNAVLRFAKSLHDLGEELSQKVIVWCLLEAKLANIVHVDTELLCFEVRHCKKRG